jgi:hypothetical protein
MDEVRVRGEPSTVWIPQTGDVLCVSRAEGWYDHTAIIIEVRGDGQWTGMDFDAFEHEEGEAAPGNRGCIFGHETEIRLIESKDFEAQYSGFNRIIEVDRREVLPGFRDRVDYMLQNRKQLYQSVPTRPDAMNCQTFHNWLLCGEGWSPDADAAVAAIHKGIMGGSHAARAAISECLERAPWDPISDSSTRPFLRQAGNSLANIFVGAVVVIVAVLMFLFGVAGRTILSYERHRLGVLQSRGDDLDSLNFRGAFDALCGRYEARPPKTTKRCIGRPRPSGDPHLYNDLAPEPDPEVVDS